MELIITEKNYATYSNSDSPYVRAQVAEQGFALEQLVNDTNGSVRAEVAKQGYGLKQLTKDESPSVRNAARCN